MSNDWLNIFQLDYLALGVFIALVIIAIGVSIIYLKWAISERDYEGRV